MTTLLRPPNSLKRPIAAIQVTQTMLPVLIATPSCIVVSIMDALDTKKPNAISLLGKELVVWRDDAGQWVCMDDQCSHRLAPLSGLTPATPQPPNALASAIPASLKK